MTLLTQLTVSVRTVLWFAKIMIKSKKYLRYIINMPERPEHGCMHTLSIPIPVYMSGCFDIRRQHFFQQQSAFEPNVHVEFIIRLNQGVEGVEGLGTLMSATYKLFLFFTLSFLVGLFSHTFSTFFPGASLGSFLLLLTKITVCCCCC